MKIQCKNCNNVLTGHYCSNCGQDAHTGKIDLHFVSHEVQHGLFHVDKGFLFTVKELFIRPGHTIREFIEGKRVKHFKPLAFLLTMAGLYAFITHYVHTEGFIMASTQNSDAKNVIEKVNEWSKAHYAIQMLLQLPVITTVCYLMFRKYKTGFLEQMVVNAYLTGQNILIRLILLPLPGVISAFIIPIGIFIWAYIQFYHKEKKGIIFFRAISAYVIYYIAIVVIISIILTILGST